MCTYSIYVYMWTYTDVYALYLYEFCVLCLVGRVWRYQRGNQNPYIALICYSLTQCLSWRYHWCLHWFIYLWTVNIEIKALKALTVAVVDSCSTEMVHVYLMYIGVIIGDIIQYIQKHFMTDLRQTKAAIFIEHIW